MKVNMWNAQDIAEVNSINRLKKELDKCMDNRSIIEY